MISFMKGWISLMLHPQSSCSVWFLRTFHIYSREFHTDSSLYKLINYSHMMSLTPSNNFFFTEYAFLGNFYTMSFAPTAAAGQQTFVFMAPLWRQLYILSSYFLIYTKRRKEIDHWYIKISQRWTQENIEWHFKSSKISQSEIGTIIGWMKKEEKEEKTRWNREHGWSIKKYFKNASFWHWTRLFSLDMRNWHDITFSHEPSSRIF